MQDTVRRTDGTFVISCEQEDCTASLAVHALSWHAATDQWHNAGWRQRPGDTEDDDSQELCPSHSSDPGPIGTERKSSEMPFWRRRAAR